MNDAKQEIIVKTWEKVIDDCKSIEELFRQPISWKIACYSPDELSNERKMELLAYYDKKLEHLKGNGLNFRFEARMQEAINEL